MDKISKGEIKTKPKNDIVDDSLYNLYLAANETLNRNENNKKSNFFTKAKNWVKNLSKKAKSGEDNESVIDFKSANSYANERIENFSKADSNYNDSSPSLKTSDAVKTPINAIDSSPSQKTSDAFKTPINAIDNRNNYSCPSLKTSDAVKTPINASDNRNHNYLINTTIRGADKQVGIKEGLIELGITIKDEGSAESDRNSDNDTTLSKLSNVSSKRNASNNIRVIDKSVIDCTNAINEMNSKIPPPSHSKKEELRLKLKRESKIEL